MDALYFLKTRTEFIRYFYENGARPFAEIRLCIENKLPPFDNLPYYEDPEPPFLVEWMETSTAEQILGMSCVSLLSDSLKLYFNTLREIIGFSFDNEEQRLSKQQGFVPAFLKAIGEIYNTDWSDCPAKLDVIEQIVLARNRGQHGSDLTSFSVTHDGKMLAKHPKPFFASEDEIKNWTLEEDTLPSFFAPRINISRDNLFAAIAEVETLAEWLDERRDRVENWRKAQRTRP